MSKYNRYREEEKELEELEQEVTEKKKKECKKDKHHGEDHECQCHHDNHECECHHEDDECGCEGDLEQLKSEIERLQDQLLRNAAELENFKRRMNEERIRDRKYALESFFRELIDIIDIFDKAVNIETKEDSLRNFLIGFQMINDRLKTTLANEGMTKISAQNQKFDPSVHHAVEKTYLQDVEEGIITEVIMDGYMYKDRVLRPSLVKVNSHDAEPENQESEIKEENNNE